MQENKTKKRQENETKTQKENETKAMKENGIKKTKSNERERNKNNHSSAHGHTPPQLRPNHCLSFVTGETHSEEELPSISLDQGDDIAQISEHVSCCSTLVKHNLCGALSSSHVC